jgi:hypothetical protein
MDLLSIHFVRTLSRVVGALLLCIVGVSSHAQEARWFQPCKQVASRSLPVREFLETQIENVGPCFLLNARELIYIDNQNGTNFQGLYFKDLNTRDYPVQLTVGSVSRPQEFVATNKKRYVLIESGWMNHGMASGQIHILYLVPRSNDGVFKIVRLVESYDNEGCVDPTQPGSCEKPEYGLRLGDGSSKAVQITSEKPLPGVRGPSFGKKNGAVEALQFELLDGKTKNANPYRYEFSAGSVDFRLATFQNVVDAVVQRSTKPVVAILRPNPNAK